MCADVITKNIPVVMLTGSREDADLAPSYELQANAYVIKPMDFQKLLRPVDELGLFWAVLNEPSIQSSRHVGQLD